MIYHASIDIVAMMRGKLQIAGVSFIAANSVKPAELKKAAQRDDSFHELVARLTKPQTQN